MQQILKCHRRVYAPPCLIGAYVYDRRQNPLCFMSVFPPQYSTNNSSASMSKARPNVFRCQPFLSCTPFHPLQPLPSPCDDGWRPAGLHESFVRVHSGGVEDHQLRRVLHPPSQKPPKLVAADLGTPHPSQKRIYRPHTTTPRSSLANERAQT